MSNTTIMSENAMLDYINETPQVLQGILNNRKEYAREFVANFLENKYEKLIIIGSGTSYHGGLSTRSFVEKLLNISVDAQYPILFKKFTSVFKQKTLVLGISQGGESKSTIQGLKYSKANNCYCVSLSEDGEKSKLAAYSDMALQLMCNQELAGPKTKGYQATMLSIIVLALEVALALKNINQNEYDTYIKRIQATIDNIQNVIESSILWYNTNREEFKAGKRMIIVGYDNNYGNVLEGRLKIEEALRYGIEGYELEEFMHGIYHSIDEGVHIVYLAQSGQYKERVLRLRDFMADYTPHEFVIGKLDKDINNQQNLSMSFVDDEDFSIFEYIIPLQILAFFGSKDLGINANIPKIKNFHYLIGSK